MKHHHAAYWLLDLFIAIMFGALALIALAHLSHGWETAADVAWSVVTLVGMGAWVRLNRQALLHEDLARRRRGPDAPGRTIPPTPVQERYLAAIERPDRGAQ
jgi:hypothetical protein